MRRALAAIILAAAPCAVSAQEVPERPFRILITNDDGYNSPGMRVLVDSLASLGEVTVAAPAEQQSGVSHSIRLKNPIEVDEFANPHGIKWYAVDARPSTTIRLALNALLDTLPDLVVSGINVGDNVGLTSWLSGTVAGAREAAFHGVPAMAVSMGSGALDDYRAAAGIVRELVLRLRDGGMLEPGLLLNVNLLAPSSMPMKGVRVARQSTAPNTANYEPRTSPRGQLYFWDMWQPAFDDVEGTDLFGFNRGYVVITPFRIDQTDERLMERLRSRLEVDFEVPEEPGG
jgi:5'-nucleotidase